MQKRSGINVGGADGTHVHGMRRHERVATSRGSRPCGAGRMRRPGLLERAARPNRVRRPARQRLGFHVGGPGTAAPAIPTRRDETTLYTTNSKEFSA